jgi:alkyl hydroperoxide reductase subunit AhpC|tara:strand:- start:129 stop:638 length:510 start_codon:yes stop_codon:yes gene_type:complete
MIGIGQKFPEVSLNGVDLNNDMSMEDTWENGEGWRVFYFYPKDFTFICPTEIAGMDILVDEAEVLGISGDNEFCKLAWKTANGAIRNIRHSLAADCGLYLAEELGIVDNNNGVAYRATYIVDPEGYIQHMSVNSLDTGRNANEVLRTLQALKAGGLTGCEWQPGDEYVV